MGNEIREVLAQTTGFDWDAGNAAKVEMRHSVQPAECEQAFFSEPFVVSFDETHSTAEPRWRALGNTAAGRWLFIVFTVRGNLIRVVGARDTNKKERLRYAEVKERLAKDS